MKKTNLKEKVQNFWNEHDVAIVSIGIGIVGGLAVGCGMRKMYQAGFVDGGMCGFDLAIDFLSKEIPETNARQLYDGWMKAHPEEIVYRKGLGKWSN